MSNGAPRSKLHVAFDIIKKQKAPKRCGGERWCEIASELSEMQNRGFVACIHAPAPVKAVTLREKHKLAEVRVVVQLWLKMMQLALDSHCVFDDADEIAFFFEAVVAWS